VEILGKRIELLKEVAPRASRVGVVYNPASPAEVHGYDVTVKSANHVLE
jgi:ABC-type uncharacterized transport system substrate-binding protein